MNTRSVLLSAALCLSPLSALAGDSGTPNNLITLAQAEIRIGPGGVTIDRDRDRDRRTDGDERRQHWLSREGNCGEWRGFWRVERNEGGAFVGRIEYENIGGPCASGTGERFESEVRAVIAGEDFFASRPGTCLYHGRLREERVRGRGLCAGNVAETFALRFLRDERLGSMSWEERRERLRDDFLDDPRTHQRDERSEFRR